VLIGQGSRIDTPSGKAHVTHGGSRYVAGMGRRVLALVLLGACAAPEATDAGASSPDAPAIADAFVAMDALVTADAYAADGGHDANDACVVDYNVGTCIATASCASMSGRSSVAGHCPGAADIQCCAPTPDLAANPPIPAGYRLMMQSEVTSAMTTWAVAILHDGATYPMFSMPTMTFGTQPVLARVEWHPPDFQNSSVHRGVTLYVPA
jgi:hypothetical protein